MFVILLFLNLFFLLQGQQNNLIITTENSILYEKTNVNTLYDYYSQQKYSCVVPKVLEENISTEFRIFKLENIRGCPECNNNISLLSLEIFSNDNVLKTHHNFKPTELQVGNAINLQVDYLCLENSKDYWAILKFHLQVGWGSESNPHNISFSYIKICKVDDSTSRFDVSSLIVGVLSVLMLAFGVRFNTFIAFKADLAKYEISFVFTIFYLIACSSILLLIYYFWKIAIIFSIILMALFSCLCIFVVLKELMEYFPLVFQCKIGIPFPYLKKITLGTILMLLASFTISLCWAIYKNYILTDICAFSILIFCLKILQVNSLKKITIFMIILMLFELMWGFIVNYALKNSYDILFSSEICLPIRIIIPTFTNFLHQKCSWVLLSSLIFPGISLCYFHKFDQSKNMSIYFRFGLMAYCLGVLAWLIINILTVQSIPMSFFSYPLIMIFALCLSYLRNEHDELWEGSFFKNSFKNEESNLRSVKSLDSNYNKEEVFEGLLSQKDSRQSSCFNQENINNEEKQGNISINNKN